MSPIRTQDSHEADSTSQDGTADQTRSDVRERYSGSSPLGRETSAKGSPSTHQSRPSDSSSGSGSNTQLGGSFEDFAARQLYDNTTIPAPTLKSTCLSDNELRKLPETLKGSLAPLFPLNLGSDHNLLGLDLTPLSVPDYDVLEKTDMKESDCIMRLREIEELLDSEPDTSTKEVSASGSFTEGDLGAESMNHKGEMEIFFDVFHRIVAVVAKDVPYIRELPPAEQGRVALNVFLLYRTGYHHLKGERYPAYPCYPTWRSLKVDGRAKDT